MADSDEPCMCGTPFTCMADEHDWLEPMELPEFLAYLDRLTEETS